MTFDSSFRVFNPNNSLTNVLVPIFEEKDYEVALCTDDFKYGGNGLVHHITYPSKKFNGQNFIELYLPARTAIVLKEVKKDKPKKVKQTKIKTKVSKSKTSKKLKNLQKRNLKLLKHLQTGQERM